MNEQNDPSEAVVLADRYMRRQETRLGTAKAALELIFIIVAVIVLSEIRDAYDKAREVFN